MDLGSRWAGVVVLAMAGCVGGFFFARHVAPREISASRTLTIHGALSGDAEIDELRGRVAELRERVRQHERLAAAYEEDLHGVTIPWPDEVEERFSAAGFRRQVERAFAECDFGADLVDFDCDELPCLMVVRVHAQDAMGRLFTECPAWSETYGPVTEGTEFRVECPDGTEERVSMRGVPAEVVLGVAPGSRRQDVTRRLELRAEQRERDWRCAAEE